MLTQIQTLICGNVALTSKANQISEDVVKKAWQNAPSKTGQSGYPHHYNDQKVIEKLDSVCHGKTVFEAPVYADGKLYPFTVKPKQNPGAFRVIYTDDKDKHYCGMISHDGVEEVKGTKKKEGTPANPNAGDFHACTAEGPKRKS